MVSHHERIRRFEFLVKDQGESPPVSPAPTAPLDRTPEPSTSTLSFEHTWRAEELRRLAQEGVPDEPASIRSATYRTLLSLSSPKALSSQYSAFLSTIQSRVAALPTPQPYETLGASDKTLREIERDVARTFSALAWFGKSAARGLENENETDREDELWGRVRLLDDADRHIASSLTATPKPAESLSALSPNSPSDIPPPLDTQSVDIPGSLDTPEASASQTRSSPELGTALPSRRPSTVREQLLRPLFVYATLNPGISYVQGMSYLAAVFFYVFASDPSLSPDEAESCTFFALDALVSQLRDLYVPTLDRHNGGQGLGATIERFQGLLLWLDPTLADKLQRKQVDLSGTILRWLTTVFANEFRLPDLLRIWDRIISVHPVQGQQPAMLSPVLSHALDLALALVIRNRATLISPYSNVSTMYAVLQSPNVEGSDVDDLLLSAWDIRERRLGRQPPRSSASTSTNRDKRTSRAGAGVLTGLLRQKLWSPRSSSPDPAEGGGFDFDRSSSSSDSNGYHLQSPGHAGGTGEEGTFGSVAFSSPRPSSDAIANNPTMVEGKLLPPPPARLQEHESIAAIVEAELDLPEYAVDAPEPLEHPSGLSSFGGWFKDSVTRMAASDTAANLSKRATNLQLAAAQSASMTASRLQSSDAAAQLLKVQTNLSIQAQLLRHRLATAGTDSGELVDSEPRETPFTPPTSSGSHGASSPSNSPGGLPRPLLLSSSARRAHNGSIDEAVDSPLSSRRSSMTAAARSPSASPVQNRSTRLPLLSPDLSIPPLSRSTSRGSHGRSSSTLETPSRPAATMAARPRSASQSFPSSLVDTHEDTTTDLDAKPRESVRPESTEVAPIEALSGLAIQLPHMEDTSSPAADSSRSYAASHEPMVPPVQGHPSDPMSSQWRPANSKEATFAVSHPSESPFVPPSQDEAYSPPDRERSHLGGSINPSHNGLPPTADEAVKPQSSLSRGAKVVRRPPVNRNRSSRGSSMTQSVDLAVKGGREPYIEEQRAP